MTAPREQERQRALDTIGRVIERDGDADDILREVVDALGPLYESVAVAFVEDGALVVGPTAGARPGPTAGLEAVPIAFEGAPVGELQVAPAHGDDRPFLERVAHLVSPYCLVGWDTGGVPWDAL